MFSFIVLKSDLLIFCFRNNREIVRIQHFLIVIKTDLIYHITGYIGESDMPYLLMEGHLKSRSQSLKLVGSMIHLRNDDMVQFHPPL